MRIFALALLAIVAVSFSAPTFAKGRQKQLKLTISKSDIDLKNRVLYFRLNRPVESADIKVFSLKYGDVIHEGSQSYNRAGAGNRLKISWPDLGEHGQNFRIELRVYDIHEFWVSHEVVRFYNEIEHDEVVFESGKWDIRPSEAPKLNAPLEQLKRDIKKYSKIIDVQVYIAGHTDTVGSVADNRELSRRRAKAIAKYFIKHGLKGVPILVRGFGEEQLAVQTGDNVDNQANRRAVYILSNTPPEMSGPGAWQKVK